MKCNQSVDDLYLQEHTSSLRLIRPQCPARNRFIVIQLQPQKLTAFNSCSDLFRDQGVRRFKSSLPDQTI